MANKCNHCGKFLATIEGVKCTKCVSLYHKACANVSPTGRQPLKWLCRGCKAPASEKGAVHNTLSSQSDNTEEAFEDAIENKTLAQEMRLLRIELASVSKEMASFRQELSRLNSVVAEFHNRVDNFEERLTNLESFSRERQPVSAEESDSVQIITRLQSEFNEREQENLLNDVEISGLDEKSGENVTHMVILLAKKLGSELTEQDIVSAERSGPRRITADKNLPPRSRPIAVRLARRALRDGLLRAARVRRGTDSAGITTTEPKRVYVNERLTHVNRHLFYKAREECRRVGWKFSWTKGGRIYVRQTELSEIRRIRSLSDVFKFFGNISI